MKKAICLFMAFAVLNLTVFASTPLTRGTIVYIRTMTEVSSISNQPVEAVVDADVKGDNGSVLIKKGTRIDGNMDVKKAKGVGKPGSITLSNLSTRSVDGQTIHLAGSVTREGESKRGQTLGLGLGLGLCLFLPCLAILAKKGGNAQILAGTVFTQFSVADDYQIE